MITRSNPMENKHVQKVILWRESMSVMPDNHFFDLMRMYLGEIKTPYNKQKLIEDLAAFLRKDENRKNLVNLLSETDLQIISAVHYITDATQEKLNAFFPGVFSFAALYERLLNLEERLILFSHSDETGKQVIIEVNPLLDEVLAPFITLENLLPPAQFAARTDHFKPQLTPLLLSAFLSYVAENPDVCKADGTIKKRAETTLEKIFPGLLDIIQYLVKACINLSLIIENEKGFVVDFVRCQAFSALSEQAQCAYLCVAANGRYSRDGFRKQAKLLLDCAKSIPVEGYSESVLLRSGILILSAKTDGEQVGKGRFSRMLESHRTEEDSTAENWHNYSANPLEVLLEPAIVFGVFAVLGETIEGERIIAATPRFIEDSDEVKTVSGSLSIDAGFSITLMPGLPLARLLPLIKFMSVRRFDSVAEFEINRKSILRALDNGLTTNDIFLELEKNSSFGIPQNLKVSIDEWNTAYSSATLYSGFVLKSDGSNRMLTEKNPLLAKYIKVVLAPGVYLLDVKSASEAEALINKCGVDFIGKVKTALNTTPSVSFPIVADGENILKKSQTHATSNGYNRGNEEDRASFLIKMKAELKALELDAEQTEGLELRIRRKIVLNKEQLRSDSVRIEKNEAGGMDFAGKIRIIEKAISTNCMVEIGMDNKLVPGVHDVVPPRILGTPLGIEKHEGEAILKLRIEPEHVEKFFSIAQASFVKRIRGSILRETT